MEETGGLKNILITGGAGYIGTNLQKYLSAEWFDYEVDICDFNQTLPLAENLRSEDIEKYDGIVHLAALSGIAACEDNPEKASRRNLLTAMNVFMEASKFRIPVIFTSSQAAKDPRSSSYAMQKRLCELMAEDLNNKGANITVFRLCNVYGGEEYIERKNTVIKKFYELYKEQFYFQIDGDGKQERDFINVEDVCVFIERALTLGVNPQLDSIDIGTGVGTSIDAIADMFNGKFPDGKVDRYPRVYMGDENRSSGLTSSIADTNVSKILYKYEAIPRMGEYIGQQIYLLKGEDT
jgi:UDP-glucose 4-epimerase